ncbi:uncharacterized protein B0I36DRAFT_346182 [Microdochium trichocladiopsis]|uniref:GPI anchored protein n=1 Tax=Microdochium trichocladiopsis TaxID=1682393 RepID=A0A9P8YHD3_9PEZI|nr:uncharacterized protein B0I36DRAFT_346182 [Microdochium trichocladiopsis]KAH7038175.1 hypothetical protein B0I36DRAFT_346182 [Microdochium trichocladiopsis]
MQFLKTILFLAFAMIGMAAPADLFELDARQEADCTCSGTVTVTVPAGGIPATIVGSSTLLTVGPIPTEQTVSLPVYGTETAIPGVPIWSDPVPTLSSSVLTAPTDVTASAPTDVIAPAPTVSEPAVTGTVTDAGSSGVPLVDATSSVLASYSSSFGEFASSATDAVEPSPTESISQGGGAAPTGALSLGAMLGGAALIAMAL